MISCWVSFTAAAAGVLSCSCLAFAGVNFGQDAMCLLSMMLVPCNVWHVCLSCKNQQRHGYSCVLYPCRT